MGSTPLVEKSSGRLDSHARAGNVPAICVGGIPVNPHTPATVMLTLLATATATATVRKHLSLSAWRTGC